MEAVLTINHLSEWKMFIDKCGIKAPLKDAPATLSGYVPGPMNKEPNLRARSICVGRALGSWMMATFNYCNDFVIPHGVMLPHCMRYTNR